jgi:hypothetical protein
MPNDLIPPAELIPPPPPEPAASSRAYILCGFCECRLVAASGDVLRMSDAAKAFRDSGDVIDGLRADLKAAREDVAAALKERDDARAMIPPKKKGIFD